MIRHPLPEDLEQLQSIEHSAFNSDLLSKRSFSKFIKKNPHFYVQEEQGRLRGYVIGLVKEHSARMRIYSLAVAPDARRKGLGKTLVKHLEKSVPPHIHTLSLEVSTQNDAAITLYSSLGFVKSAEKPQYYENGDDAIVMIKTLKEPQRINYLIVSNQKKYAIPPADGCLVLSARDFIEGKYDADGITPQTRVINLSSHFDYLKAGYYISLLADARGLRCFPGIKDITKSNWKRNYVDQLSDINSSIQQEFGQSMISKGLHELTVYSFFGRTTVEELERTMRKIFDQFRLPIARITLRHEKGRYTIAEIEPDSFSNLPESYVPEFTRALNHFTGSRWYEKRKPDQEKYWLAILHDPKEELPPSNKKALKKFIEIGQKQGFFVELITKRDLATLLEFDALFIRATTSVNDYTFRFAYKAEQEGIAVIDDTESILRCCNKIYQHELFTKHRIPVPATKVITKDKASWERFENHTYPLILKIPDGSFSRGIVKVENYTQFCQLAEELTRKSEMLLAQEFVKSEFDWRVVVMNKKAIAVCKYFMAKDHWQIINHASKSKKHREGAAEHMLVEDAPKEVVELAERAAGLIGRSLYGVDIKQHKDTLVVMEVNDNPNLDAGEEDAAIGDKLYTGILSYFKELIDA